MLKTAVNHDKGKKKIRDFTKMALNIAYNQTYSYLADAATINQAARTILQNAEQKNATNQEKASVFEMNFKANDAIRQAVISNAALQLTLDANLKETLKFLNSEAAKKIINKSKSFITLETAKTSAEASPFFRPSWSLRYFSSMLSANITRDASLIIDVS